MALLKPFGGKSPRIAPDVFLADSATLTGDVQVSAAASIWYGAVLRGDVGWIKIGARTNVQDLACIHMTEHESNAEIGEEATIGHSAIVHGATIGSGTLPWCMTPDLELQSQCIPGFWSPR